MSKTGARTAGRAEVLTGQRDRFEIPDHITYLDCAFISPLLRAARLAGEAAVSRKSRPWEMRPADFFGETEIARRLFAAICGGDPDGVAIVPSVSYGMAVAAANVAMSPGQEIVVLAEQFPSNVYPWRELARQRGAGLVTVPRPADHDWTSAVLAHLTPRTALVAVPHCHWTDGGLIDLVRLGEGVRAVGAAFAIDATQSLGALPLDVRAIQPDFLVAATYKWLLGPYGLGFLYVAPTYRTGIPVEYSWLNRAGSEDFSRLVDYRDEYQVGARRFDVGERANPILLPMAIVAMQQLLHWGVDRIAATLAGLTATVETAALAMDLQAPPARHRAGHMIGLKTTHGFPNDLSARMEAANVHVSLRGETLRVSPHVYNATRDVDRLMAVLAETCHC